MQNPHMLFFIKKIIYLIFCLMTLKTFKNILGQKNI